VAGRWQCSQAKTSAWYYVESSLFEGPTQLPLAISEYMRSIETITKWSSMRRMKKEKEKEKYEARRKEQEKKRKKRHKKQKSKQNRILFGKEKK
jgi:hypothetical protein